MSFKTILKTGAASVALNAVAVPPEILAANMGDMAYRRYHLAQKAERLRALTEQAEAMGLGDNG